ncbi:hypothetical protein KUV85_03110 [Nocardioides panacisoli]|uniref:Rv2175c family DNA-binding protein n=1 Tax=Nocardioides panacisoli TaxID=627624 RepID=UPI001C628B47|nr:Rv2175c family DNA-binding protein [Nocardioides panacisoli]QYJ04685.1 hypothetical protein KUV85_03110 [Nocardioides panacisoli]
MTELRLADQDLAALVEDWLDREAAAELLGVTPAKVKTMVKDHELAAARPGASGPPQVPAAFIRDGEPLKGLGGLLTVLHDGGYDDRECIAWIFLDDNLPGRPIDALLENRGAEAKRRAQAMAF